MRRRQFLFSAAAVLVAGCTSPAASPAPPNNYPAELAANPAMGVWPAAYRAAPKVVQTAYRYAAVNYETLRFIPCFCGCGLSSGHLNNYDCFVKDTKADGWVILDPHGLDCGTCVGITLDVIAMREQGLTVQAIRAAVDRRWAGTGPSTRTPYP
jgi:Protein of unknown function with PCYCGC motif